MSQVNKNGNTTAPKVDTRKTEINKLSLLFNKLGIWIIVAGLMVLGMIISKGQFFGKSNIQSILEAVSLVGMVCAGLFYVTYSGNMTDMSVPITMAFGGVIAVQCINFGFDVLAEAPNLTKMLDRKRNCKLNLWQTVSLFCILRP